MALLDEIPSASYHDGGRIAFGPDGMLYATVGDAGQSRSAQDRDSLARKILRMTPDTDVPDDNPYPGSLVYSYGHRNPQGLSWAPDGTMFATEFGQDTWDELNIIVPGGNYGWPEVEGIADDDTFRDPVALSPGNSRSGGHRPFSAARRRFTHGSRLNTRHRAGRTRRPVSTATYAKYPATITSHTKTRAARCPPSTSSRQYQATAAV